MSLKLVIGDKNYSSWSLRAALALDLTGEPYEEILERLYRPDSRARLLSHSPTGKVPVLLTEEGPVWDSLAIAEYLAERFPEAHLWPRGQYARALARSVCAEMHSGFVALRSHLSMDLARDQALAELPAEAQADIDRVCRLWADCRQRFGQDGAFLFGHASIADAFFAPVAARLRSYRVALPAEAAAYVETIYQWPAFRRWYQAALQEVQG
ncbi:glutathione S-transferase family protein [Aquipseudomonas alcaligenes]|uniref:Glutathione S-transferase n=1 Tax=Aquipseudomonas alcaligenes TaxID=43263 RepID=A0AA37CI79_AQUAC|nr:glutathione S-transferase family protein [Pseudomonas alcaligenes]MDH1054861.1 glutathione S-transferase family protein [Pseudomonas alcaligenes]BCR25970.1 glutathione S-transferase [Pseudomonas alcaligenes]GIZ68464.1 glutathione S-transferase [Pseudomonas alcaligenes]GIZ72847.1 glutathione S-transferase [Pseudomonas alcaligenes]GIZ77187.1 glutathione S-transferase [Pseudomonas alcaligenes]